MTRDWQIQEATEFAGRTFKRLMYYTCDRPTVFLPEVTAALTAFENRLIVDQETVAATANTLVKSGREDLALRYLTDHSKQSGAAALRLGNALLSGIEARSVEIYSLRVPQTDEMSRLSYDGVNCLP